MKMKPMGDQLLLKVKEQQEKTYKGIILTTSESEYSYAEVIAAGPGLFNPMNGFLIPMTCKVGNTVMAPTRLLSGKNGNEVVLEDQKYVLVRESEISMVSNN